MPTEPIPFCEPQVVRYQANSGTGCHTPWLPQTRSVRTSSRGRWSGWVGTCLLALECASRGTAAIPSQIPPALLAAPKVRTRPRTTEPYGTSLPTGRMRRGAETDSLPTSTPSMDGEWGKRPTQVLPAARPGYIRDARAAVDHSTATKQLTDGLVRMAEARAAGDAVTQREKTDQATDRDGMLRLPPRHGRPLTPALAGHLVTPRRTCTPSTPMLCAVIRADGHRRWLVLVQAAISRGRDSAIPPDSPHDQVRGRRIGEASHPGPPPTQWDERDGETWQALEPAGRLPAQTEDPASQLPPPGHQWTQKTSVPLSRMCTTGWTKDARGTVGLPSNCWTGPNIRPPLSGPESRTEPADGTAFSRSQRRATFPTGRRPTIPGGPPGT